MTKGKNRLLCASIVAVSCAAAGAAAAQTSGGTVAEKSAEIAGARVFLGLRLWANQWQVPTTYTQVVVTNPATGALGLRAVDRTVQSNTRFVPIPVAGVQYGKILASASFFPTTSYSTKGELNRDVGRREFDLNIGYAILPSLVLSVGYKDAKINGFSNTIANDRYTIRALLLGVSGSAPLTTSLSMYGNFAYGPHRQKGDAPDVGGGTKYSGTYTIGEFGLSYRLHQANTGGIPSSVSMSIGYRFQSVRTNGITYGTTTLPGAGPTTVLNSENRDISSSTSGPVIAVSAVF